jgi:hypothetical protein
MQAFIEYLKYYKDFLFYRIYGLIELYTFWSKKIWSVRDHRDR